MKTDYRENNQRHHLLASAELVVGLIILLAVFAGCASGPELQGHRGARALAPENTLPAFARALEIGVDVIELDTGITRDGVVVIAHDPCLNIDLARATSGEWLTAVGDTKYGRCITDMTLAEVQQYDVGRIRPGSDYAKRFPNQQSQDGTTMPTLAALFALVRAQKNERVRFNIETKISPLEPSQSLTANAFVDALLGVIAHENRGT